MKHFLPSIFLLLLMSISANSTIKGAKIDSSFTMRCFGHATHITCAQSDTGIVPIYIVVDPKSHFMKWYRFTVQNGRANDTIVEGVAAEGAGVALSAPNPQGWFKAGFRNGVLKKYYSDGRIYLSASTDADGNLKGKATVALCSDLNSDLYTEGEYNDGTKVGEWTCYDAKGAHSRWQYYAAGEHRPFQVWTREHGVVRAPDFHSAEEAQSWLLGEWIPESQAYGSPLWQLRIGSRIIVPTYYGGRNEIIRYRIRDVGGYGVVLSCFGEYGADMPNVETKIRISRNPDNSITADGMWGSCSMVRAR